MANAGANGCKWVSIDNVCRFILDLARDVDYTSVSEDFEKPEDIGVPADLENPENSVQLSHRARKVALDNLFCALFETETFATLKYDGTNVGKDTAGNIRGRNQILEPAVTRYCHTDVSCVKDFDAKGIESKLRDELGITKDATPFENFVVYGELMCNPGFFDYSALGLDKCWVLFGLMIEVQASQTDLQELINIFTRNGFYARYETDDTASKIVVMMNPKLEELFKSFCNACANSPEKGQKKKKPQRQLVSTVTPQKFPSLFDCLLDPELTEVLLNGRAEGYVLTLAPGRIFKQIQGQEVVQVPQPAESFKWKFGAFQSCGTYAVFRDVICGMSPEGGSDMEAATLKDVAVLRATCESHGFPYQKLEQIFDIFRKVCEADTPGVMQKVTLENGGQEWVWTTKKAKQPKQAVSKPVSNDLLVLRKMTAQGLPVFPLVREAVTSAQTKYDSPDSFYDKGEGSAEEYFRLIAEECVSSGDVDLLEIFDPSEGLPAASLEPAVYTQFFVDTVKALFLRKGYMAWSKKKSKNR